MGTKGSWSVSCYHMEQQDNRGRTGCGRAREVAQFWGYKFYVTFCVITLSSASCLHIIYYYEGLGIPKDWLYTIALHCMIDLVRCFMEANEFDLWNYLTCLIPRRLPRSEQIYRYSCSYYFSVNALFLTYGFAFRRHLNIWSSIFHLKFKHYSSPSNH